MPASSQLSVNVSAFTEDYTSFFHILLLVCEFNTQKMPESRVRDHVARFATHSKRKQIYLIPQFSQKGGAMNKKKKKAQRVNNGKWRIPFLVVAGVDELH